MAQVTPEFAFERLTVLLRQRAEGTLPGPEVHLPPATSSLVQVQA